jgi:hypothetical protein
MIKNIMYTGILRSGDTQSEVFPELQIITTELFTRAQEIMVNRTNEHSRVPLNTKSRALVAGLVYCAHCGSKLVLTTSGARESKQRKARYCCHYKVRHPQSCDGQSGYGVIKLDSIVEQSCKWQAFFSVIRKGEFSKARKGLFSAVRKAEFSQCRKGVFSLVWKGVFSGRYAPEAQG